MKILIVILLFAASPSTASVSEMLQADALIEGVAKQIVELRSSVKNNTEYLCLIDNALVYGRSGRPAEPLKAPSDPHLIARVDAFLRTEPMKCHEPLQEMTRIFLDEVGAQNGTHALVACLYEIHSSVMREMAYHHRIMADLYREHAELMSLKANIAIDLGLGRIESESSLPYGLRV